MPNFSDTPRLSTHDASETFVKSKIRFLMEIGVWPPSEQLNPLAWLNNFSTDERPFALNLLNIFLYFNDQLTDALFRATVQQLSAPLTHSAISLEGARDMWQRFLASVYITYVQGENPNPTDSGIVFARKARQVLALDETRILDPRNALSAVLTDSPSALMFVDDFLGSGNQMIATWNRPYRPTDDGPYTFAAAARNGTQVIFVPIVATRYGLSRVARYCPGLTVRPAHTLDDRYSLTSPDSILWPDALKPRARSFLLDASRRAGIVQEHPDGWQGFHDLALALAFSHSVPDATLPLFFWDRNGWAPLISRR